MLQFYFELKKKPIQIIQCNFLYKWLCFLDAKQVLKDSFIRIQFGFLFKKYDYEVYQYFQSIRYHPKYLWSNKFLKFKAMNSNKISVICKHQRYTIYNPMIRKSILLNTLSSIRRSEISLWDQQILHYIHNILKMYKIRLPILHKIQKHREIRQQNNKKLFQQQPARKYIIQHYQQRVCNQFKAVILLQNSGSRQDTKVEIKISKGKQNLVRNSISQQTNN